MADDQVVDTAAVEAEAKELGWVPEDQFRGDKTKWVDASTFVERGKHMMPLLRKNNEKLEGQVGNLTQTVNSLQGALKAATVAIEALEKDHDEDARAQVEAAREELKLQLKEASAAGDHEAVADITDKMTRMNVAEGKDGKKAAGGSDTVDPNQPDPRLRPEVKAWFDAPENQSFLKDRRRLALANAVSTEMRLAGDQRVGAAFMDDVVKEVEKTLNPRGDGTGKVEGGSGGGGRTVSTGKSYSDLPADAKKACDDLAKKLVGPNRAHKSVDSWRKSYTQQYFKD